jgi:signal transduction histidine kinase/CheY-like chemotaxis protein
MQDRTGVGGVFSGQEHRAVIIIIYSLAILVMVLYAVHVQLPNFQSDVTPLYVDLMAQNAYAAAGFDPASIKTVPDAAETRESGGTIVWREFPPHVPRRIVNAELPGLPARRFLFPFGEKTREFTILIPFEMDRESLAFLKDGDSVLPGIFMGCIGDNWEVFLNGVRIRSEIHLDGEGQIRSGRTWRDVFFPVDKSLFSAGTNILAFRILGDPAYDATGLYYASSYYIEDYSLIQNRHSDLLIVGLCSIYIFMGLYHILLYLNLRDESYNIFYAFFSIFLGFYSMARSRFIYQIIPDSNICVRLEYFSLFMIPLAVTVFMRLLQKQRITRLMKIYGLFCLFLGISQIFFSSQYGDDILVVYNVGSLPFIFYVFFYDFLYGFIRERRKALGEGYKRIGERLKSYGLGIVETPLGNVIIGIVVVFICAMADVMDVLFFHRSINLSRYGFFIFTIGTSFILSIRFGNLYNQLNYMKESLETTVQKRTMELEKQTMLAESASRTKSEFLARMSHEIRTPMNAIIGMSQLTLREEIGSQARNYVSNIRQAGNNLLSIINDILDFSKIESGKLDIVNGEYQIASLINDVLSIVRTRLNEKPLLFITRINGSLPRLLCGDDMRIRQVLLNILTNAIKYTREGHIIFTIYGEPVGIPPLPHSTQAGNSDTNNSGASVINMYFDVTDTGIGIKSKDMEKLFGSFERFDSGRNRGIEGTGLGLAISRQLCLLMGGDISVQSVYGKGSSFTVTLPQRISDGEPFARVEDGESKTVLIYEKQPLYAESLIYTIESLGVACFPVQSGGELREFLEKMECRFVFASSALYAEAREILEERKAKTVLVLLAEYGEVPRPDIPTLPMPLHPLAVVNILNNKTVDFTYTQAKDMEARFTAPDACVLVVDDIATNLDVAAGLLAPYKVQLHRASGGFEAVQLARKNRYDLILMDHMMPDMDGIEATAVIRAREDEDYARQVPGTRTAVAHVPIIALTANAISGMKEMFLENGFNDYLSKPIEIAGLDELLSRWIPQEKRIKAGAGIKQKTFNGGGALIIPGLDVKRGIVMTGGTEAAYFRILSTFYKDTKSRLPFFAEPPDETEFPAFIIRVHALKSAAGAIGAVDVSEEAAALETAGRSGDMRTIHEILPGFYVRLSDLIKAIGQALEEKSREKREDGANGKGVLLSACRSLKDALESINTGEINRILGEIEQLPLNADDRDAIRFISDQVLIGEYEDAVTAVDRIIGKY